MIIRLAFTYLIFMLFQASYAQTVDSLPIEKSEFIKAVSKKLDDTKRADLKDLSKEFQKTNESGAFNETLLKSMIENSNQMLYVSNSIYPFFSSLVDFYLKINSQNISSKQIQSINTTLLEVMKNSKRGDTKSIISYFDFLEDLYTKNALYYSTSKSWYITSNEINLFYDEGPKVSVGNTTLTGATSGDTIKVFNTKGEYDVANKIWYGVKGEVDWTKAGLPKNEVFANFGAYEIDLNKQSYKVDSATFTYQNYLKGNIIGAFEDKLLTSVRADNIKFPKFSAKKEDVPPQEITQNVVLYGGFMLEGSKISANVEGERSTLIIYKPNSKEKILVAHSPEISVKKPQKVNAANAEVSLYFDGDSIYHPNVNVNFSITKNEIKLVKGDGSLAQSKFINSHHKVEFDADIITWNLNEDFIDINTVSTSGIKAAVYESKNYFTKEKMQQIKGYVGYDPLSILNKHATKFETNEMTAYDFAKAISPNMTVQQTKTLLYQLIREGFINFDENAGLITIYPKVSHYIKSNAKISDFDNIVIESKTKEQNGRIDLKSKDIKLEGVQRIPISLANSTIFMPDSGKLNLKKNRDMEFDGMFFCGRLDFFGKNNYFEYDSFNMVLPEIDTLIMNIPDGDKLDQYGKPVLRPINSVFENLKGDININIPINKSGRAELLQFPIFNSINKSYIYYDSKNIKGGAYDRERFYYEVQPFTLDSLNILDVRNTSFPGTLYSADIFPAINEPLTVQKDLTLGFEIKTPEDGFDLYKGKGKFISDIKLDGDGLKGEGDVEFKTTYFDSDQIQFYPDSMLAVSNNFTIKQSQGSYESPDVTSYNNKINWKPYADSMLVQSSSKDPFIMYDERIKMDGFLNITDKGIAGGGVADWDDAELTSNYFDFKSEELNADTAALVIKSIYGDKVTFNTPNVNAYVNFKDNTGFFKSNTKDSKTEFGYNQYFTTIDEFFWDIDKKNLEFSVPKGSTEGAPFTSMHPKQDSLSFLAKKANYNLETSIIEAFEVEEILVADSRIIPDKGEVSILPEAKMKTLKNAVLEASVETKRHIIENVTADIKGRNEMNASGRYIYSAKDTDDQYIEMTDIRVVLADSSMLDKKKKSQKIEPILKGDGIITKNQNYILYPNVNFYGKVTFLSTLENLRAKGFLKIDFKNQYITSNYIEIESEVNRDDLELELKGAKNPEGKEVRTGIFVSKAGAEPIYTNILNNKIGPIDIPMIETDGVMKHLYETNEYLFGVDEKINQTKEFARGTLIKFSPETNIMKAEGTLDLGLVYPAFDEKFYGTVKTDLAENRYRFNTTIALPFEFDKEIIERLGYYFYEDNFDLLDIDYSYQEILQQWAEYTNEKDFKQLTESVNRTGFFEKQKAHNAQIILTDVNLEYNPIERVYRSEGKIGLSFIGERGIHKQIEGWLEFGHRFGADYFNIYLKTSFNDYLFITFSGTNMEVYSTFDDVKKMVSTVDGKKRKIMGENNQFYIYFLGNEIKARAFLQRMKNMSDEEYQEEAPKERKKTDLFKKDVNDEKINIDEIENETQNEENKIKTQPNEVIKYDDSPFKKQSLPPAKTKENDKTEPKRDAINIDDLNKKEDAAPEKIEEEKLPEAPLKEIEEEKESKEQKNKSESEEVVQEEEKEEIEIEEEEEVNDKKSKNNKKGKNNDEEDEIEEE